MTLRAFLITAITAIALAPLGAWADWQRLGAEDVEIEVVADHHRRSLPQYAVEDGRHLYRGYVEARQGEEYTLRVRNKSSRRIGLVIAVDGRNIISGNPSDLGRDERMYILGPGERGEYRGWRTSRNQVNRFYFTDAPDSYSGRWGDYSAMGVIAVAAYAEKQRHRYPEYRNHPRALPERSPTSEDGRIAPRHMPQADEPGTGFGKEEWSPSRRVEFEPRHKAFARYFLKYEWPETLCDKGMGRCYKRHAHRGPELHWDRDDFAPPPPGFDRNRFWW